MATKPSMILSIEEVRSAIYADDDFDSEELERLSQLASSFIYEKTGYDFGKDDPVNPLAKQCARLYVLQQHKQGDSYQYQYDYSFGIGGMLIDLQAIGSRLSEEAEEEDDSDE